MKKIKDSSYVVLLAPENSSHMGTYMSSSDFQKEEIDKNIQLVLDYFNSKNISISVRTADELSLVKDNDTVPFNIFKSKYLI